ncbi:MAG: ABC transporter permease subunit [Lachnospiraceae bacterium]|nr:ABC transporter permease subunit [Lachnospiraceae bacterium]
MMKNRRFVNVLLSLFFGILLFAPPAGMLLYSFFARWSMDAILPETFTLKGFAVFFKRDAKTALDSALFSAFVAFVTLLIGIPAAKGLAGIRSRFGKVMESLLILPMLLPVVTVSIGSHKLFLALGFTGSAAVFVMHLYFALPYAFKILYSAYRALGESGTVTAKNLGATEGRAFFLVEVPMFLPAYTSAFVMGFVVSYSQYFVNLYLGGAKGVNFSVVLSQLLTGSDRNTASVYSLMYLLYGAFVIGFSEILQRLLLKRRTEHG